MKRAREHTDEQPAILAAPDAPVETVRRRDGREEAFSPDQLKAHLHSLATMDPPLLGANLVHAYAAIRRQLCNAIHTDEITKQIVGTCALLGFEHWDYVMLASRALIHAHHRRFWRPFSEVVRELAARDVRFHPTFLAFVDEHRATIDAAVEANRARDFQYDVFGFSTLSDTYLLRDPGAETTVCESPQHLLMREAIQVMGLVEGIEAALVYYDHLSALQFTHATPTCHNSGLRNPQLASCFVMAMGDNIGSIFGTLTKAASVSKYGGGLGISIRNIRAINSRIAGTNGKSNGIVPMMQVYNYMARYVDQGGGKRKGAVAMYIEPWHTEIADFIAMRNPDGDASKKSLSLNHGLWTPDVFMQRWERHLAGDKTVTWTLFDPCTVPLLADLCGDAFTQQYIAYENDASVPKTTLNAEKFGELLKLLCLTYAKMGQPYMQFKDAINERSNHRHLGIIQGSNLCTEINQYFTESETTMCNLASICLSQFVRPRTWATRPHSIDEIDEVIRWEDLRTVVRLLVRGLNHVIDLTYYVEVADAVEERFIGRTNNLRHRPIGIGTQGLADVFLLLFLPFAHPVSQEINARLFEWIYLCALRESCDLARVHGPHESFAGSPLSEGKFQFDLADARDGHKTELHWAAEWAALRTDVMRYGVRNSLLIAPMPTASTSQIMGNTECNEPVTSLMYARNTKSGQFSVINKHFMRWLQTQFTTDVVRDIANALVLHRGSVLKARDEIRGILRPLRLGKEATAQFWDAVPVFETFADMATMRTVIDMANARGRFIDQSQSFNVRVNQNKEAAALVEMMSKMIVYHWKHGGKGLYYCHKMNDTQEHKMLVCGVPSVQNAESQPQECSLECTSCSA